MNQQKKFATYYFKTKRSESVSLLFNIKAQSTEIEKKACDMLKHKYYIKNIFNLREREKRKRERGRGGKRQIKRKRERQTKAEQHRESRVRKQRA